MEGRILVVDDDLHVREFLLEALQAHAAFMCSAETLQDGLELASLHTFDVVLLDVVLPDGSGLKAIETFRRAPGHPEVVIMTGQGDPHGAALALKHGAWDYLCKPLSAHEVRLAVTRAMDFRRSAEATTLTFFTTPNFVTTSTAMGDCMKAAARAATSDIAVLISGETGTGKELLARGIHQNSRRAPHAFVVVDCTAIPEPLIESHLFGHEKGAFTGADRRRIGLVQLAHQGTLFLDEVGDLPLSLQAKFLRLLQEKTFRPVGAKEEIYSDFRLLAATHRNLEAMVKEGRFREDLYYRMAGMKIGIPPLRDRKEDILPIVQDLLRRENQRSGKELKGLSPDFVETLLQYSWPGNVRELVHAVQYALAVSGENQILFAVHLPEHVRVHVTAARIPSKEPLSPLQPHKSPDKIDEEVQMSVFINEALPTFKEYREKIMNRAAQIYLLELKKRCGKDLQKACAVSGLSRSRLYALIKETGLQEKEEDS
ncbi:MAG: sigma-54 dependent transcriptional regulator [Desulfosoma sp.]